MLKLFLLLVFAIFSPADSMASEAAPAACEPYLEEFDQLQNTRLHDSIPYGEGLLWEISADNRSKGYLFGTMHSQDRLITSLPPAVRLTLVKSSKLVMEVIPDQHANEIFNQAIYFSDDKNLKNMVDGEIFAKLAELAPDYGVPVDNITNLKPWAAFSLFGRPKPVKAMTQEMVLMQIADNTNKPVAALETMEELVETLESIPPQDQLIILNDTICNYQKILQQSRELVDLYLARDLAGMVIFNEQPHYDEAIFDRFMQKILYERNHRIVGRIENYLKEGNVFIAIGAMHLPDEKGLLKLLENRGYTIRPVY